MQNKNIFNEFYQDYNSPEEQKGAGEMGVDVFMEAVTHPLDVILSPGKVMARVLDRDLKNRYKMETDVLTGLTSETKDIQNKIKNHYSNDIRLYDQDEKMFNDWLRSDVETLKKVNDINMLEYELIKSGGDIMRIEDSNKGFIKKLAEEVGTEHVKFKPGENYLLNLRLNHLAHVYNAFIDTLNWKNLVIEEGSNSITSPIGDVVKEVTGVDLNHIEPGKTLQNPFTWLELISKQLFGIDLTGSNILFMLGVGLLVIILISRIFDKLL